MTDKMNIGNDKTNSFMNWRDEVNSMTDEELSAKMLDDWEKGIIDESKVDASDLEKIWLKIRKRAGVPRSTTVRVLKVVELAAAIMFPILLIGFCFMGQWQGKTASLPDTVFSTKALGKATVKLSDGTVIDLNSESSLSYSTDASAGSTREVRFEGEGYYKVARNESKPFVIHTDGMTVEVLGTEFNLTDRLNESKATVSLTKGKVRLTAMKTKRSVMLMSGQTATLDKLSGRVLTHKSAGNVDDAAAWRRNEIVFRDVPLAEVIAKLEQCYGKRIVLKAKNIGNEPFNGTVPSDNMDEALEIIAKSYHLKATKKDGGVIVLKNRK